MDELELRRRLFADPQSTDAAIEQQLQQDPKQLQLQRELIQLDQQIKQQLQVEVPADLAARLLLNQRLGSHQRKQVQRRWWLSAAASLLLVGVLGQQYGQWFNRADNIGDLALSHVYHELAALEQTQSLPLVQVQQLLAQMGAELPDWQHPIRYARFCDFQGVRSLHLVMDSSEGSVTVFILPLQHGLKDSPQFSDRQFFGQSGLLAKAEIIMVSTAQDALLPLQQELTQKLKFNI